MGEQDERGYVESGMELLQWRYEADAWHSLQVSEVVRRSRDTEGRSPLAVGGVMASGGLLLGALIAGLSGHWTATGAFAGVALGLGLVLVRHTPRPETSDETTVAGGPPLVLFTSTGVIFGQQARRWRADDYRLAFVVLEQGAEPALVLEFDGELRTAAWRIPVPPALAADVEDLATVLHAKTLEDAGLAKPLAGQGVVSPESE